MSFDPPPSRIGPRAFTLVEMVAVVVIASILAAAVIPSVTRLGVMRESAGAWEVRRQLTYARERAIASGTPAGVRFVQADQTIELRSLSPAGGVTTLNDALGRPEPMLPFAERFSADFRADAVSPVAPAGEDRSTLWFGHNGTPHARTNLGEHAGDLGDDFRVMVGGDAVVIVRAISGLVEGP